MDTNHFAQLFVHYNASANFQELPVSGGSQLPAAAESHLTAMQVAELPTRQRSWSLTALDTLSPGFDSVLR